MLHPSYTEIMKEVNANVEEGNEPVVNSRYSIVIASAKRARQIIDAQKNNQMMDIQKPLSTAVNEIYTGSVKILSEEEAAALEEEMEAAAAELEELEETAAVTEETEA